MKNITKKIRSLLKDNCNNRSLITSQIGRDAEKAGTSSLIRALQRARKRRAEKKKQKKNNKK